MAPLLALLTIFFGGEAPASAKADAPQAIVQTVVLAQPEAAASAEPEVRTQRWLGKVELPGQAIDFVVTIVETELGLTGTLDIPVQGLQNGQLKAVEREGNELRFSLEIPGQPESVWPQWTVKLDEAGTMAIGVLNQSGASFPSRMTLDETGEAEVLNRPQHPKRPFPYREVEVTLERDGFALAGTLTLPDEGEFGAGPYPGVVLITGSGPQDRDETILGHKPFFVLSDRLARRGIAAVRYDERGVAASGGSFAGTTSLGFAEDARAWAEWLGEREEIASVGLVGHSEGGMIAPIVAAGNPGVDFVVLLAAPTVRGSELLLRQSREIAALAGASADMIDRQDALMRGLHEMALAGKGPGELREEARALLVVQLSGSGSPMSGPAFEQMVDLTCAQFTDPWFVGFLSLDPRPELASMTQPVLALNGSKDVQVPPDQNLGEIERVFAEAGKSEKLTALDLEGLNHLFQPTTTGGMEEYGVIETTFDESALERIAAWILKNAR